MAKQDAIQDNNKVFALIAHSGTAGTAETIRLVADSSGKLQTTATVSAPGTQPTNIVEVLGAAPSASNPLAVRLTDGTTYYNASGGAGGGTTVQFNNGTVDLLKAGTVTVVSSVANLAAGTITKLEGGTVGLITRVSTLGTLEVGTISALPNIPGGTVGLVSTVSSVTEVANLAKGTVTRVEGGTITVSNPTGTIVQFNNGTVDLLKAGTITRVEGGTLGLVSSVTEVANVAKGTITRVEGGTITLLSSLTNLAAGTVTRLEGGSVVVTTGTIVSNGGTQGKINPQSSRHILSYGTTTNGTIGTLVAAPSAGSSIFLTSLKVNVQNGTAEPVVSFNLAANGAGVVDRGRYFEGGGVARHWYPGSSFNNTGTALTFNILSGSGTISYDVTYFVDVP